MKTRDIIGGVLVISGICCMVYAIYIKTHVEAQKDELVARYEDYIDSVNNNGYTEQETEDGTAEDTSEAVSETDELPALTEPDKSAETAIPAGIIGIMEIDKIDLSVTIAEGTDNKSIALSVGHFPNTAMPGQIGNFAVVGHRSYRYGAYFNRLDELAKGDVIKVKTAKGIYRYTVDSQFVVEPTDTWVLEPTEGAEITLVTCTPIRTAAHRLIIKGHLSEEQ